MCLWTWIGQEGPSADKHKEWAHPLTAMVIHYTIASILTFGIHDAFIDANDCVLAESTDMFLTREAFPLGVAAYAVWLLLWRLYHASDDHRPGILYEYTWLCNVTLLLGAVALLTDRPIVATAHCVAVGIDQLMWYVDLVGWAIRSVIVAVYRVMNVSLNHADGPSSSVALPSSQLEWLSTLLGQALPLQQELHVHIIFGPFPCLSVALEGFIQPLFHSVSSLSFPMSFYLDG